MEETEFLNMVNGLFEEIEGKAEETLGDIEQDLRALDVGKLYGVNVIFRSRTDGSFQSRVVPNLVNTAEDAVTLAKNLSEPENMDIFGKLLASWLSTERMTLPTDHAWEIVATRAVELAVVPF